MLSSVAPEQMETVVRRLVRLMRPGGRLLFRDYGSLDLSQLRATRRVSENVILRGDGTTCFHFSLETCEDLFERRCGLVREKLEYHCTKLVNRRTATAMHRVFLNAVWTRASD